jgi:hypothetical protein
MALISVIVGTIPIRDGAGWDGSAYINHIQSIAAGNEVVGDPYRLSRMGGFIHLIILSSFGLSREALISFQVVFNILLISVGSLYFYDYLRLYGVRNKIAIISTSILLFSWPVLILPVYYPILSDHVVIAAVCLSLWFWIRGYQNGLYFLCLWTPWVMPLLVLVPLVLASMPFKGNTKITKNEDCGYLGLEKNMLQVIIFLLLAIPSLIYAWLYMSRFTDESILMHANVKAGMPELRIWSALAVCVSITAISWVWAMLINSKALFYSLKLTSLIAAILFTTFSYMVMMLGLDWSNGFKGPNLVQNMFTQSLGAPFKPYITHVLYFGPVLIFALTAFSLKNYKALKLPWALVVLFAGFLPLLAIGSESRQWLSIFPVFVALFALLDIDFRYRITCFVFAIILCLPALGLSEAIIEEVNNARLSYEYFLSSNWQYYFGRQGPWTSPLTYLKGVLLISLFLFVIFFQGRIKKQKKPDDY